MALTVATNTGALMAQAAASSVNKEMEISMERLATGKRINGASDDAAGVAIASRLSAEIKGTNQAIRNAMDGQALIDTAEGAHQEIENILQRMREISVQARNDTNDADDRANLQLEMDALTTEIDRIANSTTWAGQKLLTGNGGNHSTGKFDLQVGSGTSDENTISTSIKAMTAAALGVGAGNASVGVNGASAKEVGENTILFSGVPAVGDVYSLKVNGNSVDLKIAAVHSDDAQFTYQFRSSNHTPTSGAANDWSAAGVHGGSSAGKGVADVALAMKKALDAFGAGTGSADGGSFIGDVTGTVNSDGTLTVSRPISITDNTSTADAGSVVVTTVNTSDHDKYITMDATTDAKFINRAKVTINNVAFDANNATGSDAWEDSAAGTAAQLQSLIDAKIADGELAGFTVAVSAETLTGTGAGDIKVRVTRTDADLVTDVSAVAGNSSSALDITSSDTAKTSIAAIDDAIKALNNQRASLGAISNRLDSTVSNLTNISSNLQAGRGRIEDADFAAETTSLAKSQILQQASTAMLAQANASKQNVLSLLQG